MKNTCSRACNPKACNRRVRWYDRGRTNPDGAAREKGFTLVELVIVIAIVPVIVGALAYGLVAVIQLQSGVSNRLTDTEDAQVVSSTFGGDVQSAADLTTNNSTVTPGYTDQCGSGYQILGLKWGENSNKIYENIISYMSQEVGTTGTYEMVRQYCTDPSTSSSPITSSTTSVPNPGGPVLASSVVLSVDLPNSQPSPIFSISTAGALAGITPSSAAEAWVSSVDITQVSLAVTEPLTGYSYNLVGVPASTSTGGSNPTPSSANNNTTCGFAQPGTGNYANNLCFIDFSTLTATQIGVADSYVAPSGSGSSYNPGVCGLETSVTVPGGFTMYFCLGLTGEPVSPFALPTYGEAFLGNSFNLTAGGVNYASDPVPFYIGVPGDPSLYQLDSGASSVILSNIEVVNSQEVAATGWELVSIDAESTDVNESIKWTSDQPLSILANNLPWDTSSDPLGNACGNELTTTGDPSTAYNYGLENSSLNPVTPSSLVSAGINTYQIACYGTGTTGTGVAYTTTSSTKNGTAMLAATTPTSFSAQMVGSGLEAVSFGVLIAGKNG